MPLVSFGFAVSNGTILMETVVLGLCHDLGQTLAFGVRLVPEVGEERKEDDAVNPDEVDEDRELVIAGGHEVVLGNVDGDDHKLQLGAKVRKVLQRKKTGVSHAPPSGKDGKNLGNQFRAVVLKLWDSPP